jgi:hypothetical protein
MAGMYLRLMFSLGLWMALAPWAVFASGSGCGAAAEDDAAPSQAGDDTPAGQTIYVDPVTGELTDPPEPVAPDPDQVRGPQPPEPDLNVVRLPDGTVRADVGDRFVTELRIEVVDGKPVTCHRPLTPAPEPSASKENGEGDG